MRVTNMQSPRSGSPVANQYIINDGDTETFQSYQTIIAKKTGADYTISGDWNYSRTTSKYFYEWLRGYSWSGQEISDLCKWLKKAEQNDTYQPETMHVTVTFVESL